MTVDRGEDQEVLVNEDVVILPDGWIWRTVSLGGVREVTIAGSPFLLFTWQLREEDVELYRGLRSIDVTSYVALCPVRSGTCRQRSLADGSVVSLQADAVQLFFKDDATPTSSTLDGLWDALHPFVVTNAERANPPE